MKRRLSVLLCVGLLVLPLAAQTTEPTAAELLDEALWWPGDFAQLCKGDDTEGPWGAPNLRAYDTIVAQEYFLSKPMIERLRARRADLIPEINRRLEAFHWDQPPHAPEVSSRVNAIRTAEWNRFVMEHGDGPGPGAWKPVNSRVLSGAMLRIINAIDAVESLPVLIRLEKSLDTLNKKAVDMSWGLYQQAPAHSGLPVIDLGGDVVWDDYMNDWRRQRDFGRSMHWMSEDKVVHTVENSMAWILKPMEADRNVMMRELLDTPPDLMPWMAWQEQAFRCQVFQREILGVCLRQLERAGYAPLKDSLVGRLRDLGLRRLGLRIMSYQGITSKADFAAKTAELAKEAPGLAWNESLGVALYPDESVLIPGTTPVCDNARALIQAFVDGTAPPAPVSDGLALLNETVQTPGDWNQMCGFPPPLPKVVPLPDNEVLGVKYFNFGKDKRLELLAHRDCVVPALTEVLRRLTLGAPPEVEPPEKEPAVTIFPKRSGQSVRRLGPLLLSAVALLNAVETLPDLLRLEQELHEIIARAGRDPKFTPPDLDLDSPVSWEAIKYTESKNPAVLRKNQRQHALFACLVYQRELLGLIHRLLDAEKFAPLRQSKVEAAYKAAGRKEMEASLADIKSEEQLEHWLEWTPSRRYIAHLIKWSMIRNGPVADEEVYTTHRARITADIAYSEAARDELRQLGSDYLKTTQPGQRRAVDGMRLPWLGYPEAE